MISKQVKLKSQENQATWRPKKHRGFGKETPKIEITTKQSNINKNDSLKYKKGWIKKSTRDLDNKFSTQAHCWWTNLQYVMAIKMQSGCDGEESSGLFILRNTSGLHHTVAFEDRSDGTNFCFHTNIME